MKKFLIVIAILIVIGAIASTNSGSDDDSSGDGQTVETKDNRVSAKDKKGKVKVTDKDFSVKEYHYVNILKNTEYFLVVTNNSAPSVGIDINMTAYDKDNNVIGAGNGSITVLGKGETSIAPIYFNNVDNIDHVSYNMTYDTSPFYSPVLSDLKIVENVNPKNVVVTITNNGSKAAKFVEVQALFFDSKGNLVNNDSTFITDNDFEIKPGATISEQLDFYGKSFAKVECYYTGRR